MLEQFIFSFQILIIDVVMAADNVIIISLIAANFAPENRRKIIAWGVAAAFLFRIMFATGANFIFEFAWVKILGGIALLWVINNLRQDFFGQNKIRSPSLRAPPCVAPFGAQNGAQKHAFLPLRDPFCTVPIKEFADHVLA